MQLKTGRIVHYGRAELKQSDHRPVLAVIDIEGRTVIDSKLASSYEAVVASLGPSDCTVVVQVSLYLYMSFVNVKDDQMFKPLSTVNTHTLLCNLSFR